MAHQLLNRTEQRRRVQMLAAVAWALIDLLICAVLYGRGQYLLAIGMAIAFGSQSVYALWHVNEWVKRSIEKERSP